jgi:hypothetical protein
MNWVERRVRNAINPYSTAFARWWCQTGRHTRLGRMITAEGARLAKAVPPSKDDEMPDACVLHPPTVSMAARRAAIDAVLAEMEGEQGEGIAGS